MSAESLQPSTSPAAPWYDEAFGADYLERYAHRDDEEAERAVALVLRFVDLPHGSRTFDLCCGAGRHLRFLREHGMEAYGGDRSLALLRAARPGCRCLVRLDMRVLPCRSESFDLVTNFFTAFGYFSADEENFGVLMEVRRVLKPDGWFALDFLNAHTARAAVLANPHQEVRDPERGIIWTIRRRLSPDGLRSVKIQEKVRHGVFERTLREEVRLYTAAELSAALELRGFEIAEFFGDYDGSDFDERTSPRALFLCRRRG